MYYILYMLYVFSVFFLAKYLSTKKYIKHPHTRTWAKKKNSTKILGAPMGYLPGDVLLNLKFIISLLFFIVCVPKWHIVKFCQFWILYKEITLMYSVNSFFQHLFF